MVARYVSCYVGGDTLGYWLLWSVWFNSIVVGCSLACMYLNCY